MSSALAAQPPSIGDAEAEWATFQRVLHGAAAACLGPAPKAEARRPWISAATAQMAASKRAAWQRLQDREAQETADPADVTAAVQAYKAWSRQTRAACARDKRAYTQRMAAEVSGLMQTQQAGKAWRLLNVMTGRRQQRPTSSIRTADGSLVSGPAAARALGQHFASVFNVPSRVPASLIALIPTHPSALAPPPPRPLAFPPDPRPPRPHPLLRPGPHPPRPPAAQPLPSPLHPSHPQPATQSPACMRSTPPSASSATRQQARTASPPGCCNEQARPPGCT